MESPQTQSGQEEVFSESEKVLAYHQNFIYEAKILKVEQRTIDAKLGIKKPFYLLHYLGWNERWDEWVDASRMLKNNEANRKIQDEMKADQKKNNKKGGTKRKGDEKFAVDPKFKLEFPYVLRKRLVDDWDLICNQKHLVSLPRSSSVSATLQRYLASLSDADRKQYQEVMSGIQDYFDKALGTLLLYRFERHQYSETLKKYPGTSLSETYGHEHLLRLFVKLPQLLSVIELDDEAVNTTRSACQDFLRWVSENVASLPTSYEPATPMYIRMAYQ